jgi:hypothetical protein
MKKSPQTILFVVSGALFLLGALVLVWWTKNFHAWKLREHLQIISPLFLEITFLLVIVATVLNLRVFKRVFAGITRGSWYAVGGITVIGLLIIIFVVPRDHRIYYDEDIYQSIGQNIACLKSSDAHSGEDYEQSFSNVWKRFIGRAAMCNEGRNEYGEFHCDRLEYNKEPNGWPYLLSVVFRLFGVHERAAFLTNNLLYGLAIVTVFLIGYLLFESALPGVYAALIFALTPEFMMWANTTAVEPSAALFPGLALLSALIFVRSRENTALWLLAVMTAFAVQFRPESIMLLMVIGLVVLFWGSYTLRRGEFYLLLAIFFILMIPHLVHLYSFKDAGWGSSGPKFSTEYFKGNFKVNALFYLKNIRFPLLFTVLFGLGIVLKAGKGDRVPTTFHLRAKLVLLSWFLLFWGIFIFFYAGSYNYGADVRFSLLSAMPLALLAGYGAVSLEYVFRHRLKFTYLSYVLPVIIAFSFLPFLPFVRAITQEAWGARADHRFAKEMANVLPDDAVVLTHNPNMFLLWGKNAAQASLPTEQKNAFKRFFYRYKGGIYFHYNFWCNVPDKLQNSFCTNILERYDCTPVLSFKEQNYTFELYKVEKKKRTEKEIGGTKKPSLND